VRSRGGKASAISAASGLYIVTTGINDSATEHREIRECKIATKIDVRMLSELLGMQNASALRNASPLRLQNLVASCKQW
jgi:hypothetical protein